MSDTVFSRRQVPSLLAVFLLALAVRFAFLAIAGPHTGGDSPEYVTLALPYELALAATGVCVLRGLQRKQEGS